MRHRVLLPLAILLAIVVTAPAAAATPQPMRTFTATLGTAGSGQITVLTNSYGTFSWSLHGLRRSATYRAVVYRGSCARLGTAVGSVGPIVTNSSGAANGLRNLNFAKAQSIWEANWYATLALRIVNGSSILCGNLGFVHATRVVIPNQGVMNANIDLAIVRSPSGYPYCNVAMYNGALSQPRELSDWATFLFAHARKGMFLPLLDEWRQNRGADLVGKYVYVYTSNNKRHTYRIDSLAVGKENIMNGVFTAGFDKVWLQTSTGPNFTYPKLFVKTSWVSTITVTWAASHPTPHIVKCG